ncbi:protein CBFA2T1 isoform X5 [Bos indicus]|uniref:Protein CBFA2T1 isoform X5 n=1 Tax=Bos indicus TaxID=9915 RepID=A0ABM4TG50_BOSIN
MISVKRNTWRALSLVIGDCRKKGNFEYCQDRTEKHSTMPDSPVDVKTPSRLTPPTMPPPPTTQGAPRTSSFTPTTLTNGSSHSPTALNGAPSPPNGFSNGPSSSSSSSLANQQLPPACGARQLSKLKRFLTTLQQFGNDISPEIGERVRTLVLGLVNSTLTIEEFHSKLQEATNFPLRPFVIPFLKANLPLLQRELLHCARLAKQNPAQYLAQHEQLLLDASTTSPVDSSELLLDVNENGKRRTPDRTKENGFDREPLHSEHPSKRPCTISPGQRYSPNNGLSYQPNGLPHPTPPPQHYRLDDMAIAHHYRDSYRHPSHRDLRDRNRPMGLHGTRQEEMIDHRLTDREWAEEWKHLDHLLNCIMDMVEKTRRSLTVLRRCQEADREELNYWIRRYSDTEDLKKGGSSSSSHSRQQSPVNPDPVALVLGGKQQQQQQQTLRYSFHLNFFYKQISIQSALHIHRFHTHGFSQPHIKNFRGKKNPRKFQKAKLEFAMCWQLLTKCLHCIALRIISNLEMI